MKPLAMAIVGCALLCVVSLIYSRAAVIAGREKIARLATLAAAVFFVPLPGIGLIGILSLVAGPGPLVSLMVFTIALLAVSGIAPMAQALHRYLRTASGAGGAAVSPYAAVDVNLPVLYWPVEILAVFAIVGLIGLLTDRLLGPGFVLPCAGPITVTLPTLFRATVAPRFAARRLAARVAEMRGRRSDGDLDEGGLTDASGQSLGDVRSWTASLAEAHGVSAPAVVLARNSATFVASSDPSNAVIVIDGALFRAFRQLELQAVIAHEIAHLKRDERLRRAVAEALFDAWYVLIYLLLAHFRGSVGGTYLIVWLLTFAYGREAVRRWSTRRGEFLADRTAAEWLGDAEPMISALNTIARVRGIPLGRRLGQRPSFGERIAALGDFQGSST